MSYTVVTTLHANPRTAGTWYQEASHIDLDDMLKESTADESKGRRVDVVLGIGDTAYAPGTTKKVFMGPGTITYLIYPSGVEAYPVPGKHVPTLIYKA